MKPPNPSSFPAPESETDSPFDVKFPIVHAVALTLTATAPPSTNRYPEAAVNVIVATPAVRSTCTVPKGPVPRVPGLFEVARV